MNRGLFMNAVSRFFAGLVTVGPLLFLPAGTFRWPPTRLTRKFCGKIPVSPERSRCRKTRR